MQKTITYYFPNSHNPSVMKVFQDRSSQVRAFRFQRDLLNEMLSEEYIQNYAVYFLFNEKKNEGKCEVYVGQSKLGAKRILEHCKKKDFWDYCIMFVSDNNVFDSNAIDYMEYFFINLLKDSGGYELYNVDQRNRVPNLNYFDKITYHMYLEQIDFLLKAEGVDFKKKTLKNSKIESNENEESVGQEGLDNLPLELDFDKVYSVKRKNNQAYLKINEDLSFSILPNSILVKPSSNMLTWSDNGKIYKEIISSTENLLKEKKVKENDENTFLVVSEIKTNSPSEAGRLVKGAPVNGWDYFEGLNEIRNIYANLKTKWK